MLNQNKTNPKNTAVRRFNRKLVGAWLSLWLPPSIRAVKNQIHNDNLTYLKHAKLNKIAKICLSNEKRNID